MLIICRKLIIIKFNLIIYVKMIKLNCRVDVIANERPFSSARSAVVSDRSPALRHVSFAF